MAKRRRRRKRGRKRGRGLLVFSLAALLAVFVGIRLHVRSDTDGHEEKYEDSSSADSAYWYGCPEIDAQLLTPNSYSRPQIELKEVNAIVIHYTANPGSTAQENRDYFEGLRDSHVTKASAHFIVGLKGEVIQLIPTREMAYANNPRNHDTISIECCHPDDTGKFSDRTYASVVKLTAWLCRAKGLSPDEVIRHYDVSGKDCPKYYVEHEDAWEAMKADIGTRYEELASSQAS